jgi:predicted transcriptional regulator of viral defense system
MPQEGARSERDRRIARVAANQHGVVTSTQLCAAGVSASAISDRVKAGRLHRVHRGVYAVGHARLSQHGIWMAAVLACGDGAVLSHQSAAALWRITASHPALPRSRSPAMPGASAARRLIVETDG